MTRVVGTRIHYIQTIFSVPKVSIFSLVVVDSVTAVLANLVSEVTPKECYILDRVVLPSGKQMERLLGKVGMCLILLLFLEMIRFRGSPQSDNQAALSIN
jgi:hypothetical protein